jgi:hypothetical protein
MSTEGSTAARHWAQRHYRLRSCLTCGRPAEERHHPDPSSPRTVWGLCRRCHAARHPREYRRAPNGQFAEANGK